MTSHADIVAANPSPFIPTYLSSAVGGDTAGVLENASILIEEAIARCNRAHMASGYAGNRTAADKLNAALALIAEADSALWS